MTDSTRPVALVTGSSSGIGAAVARMLDERGYRIACNGVGDAGPGEAIASSLADAVYLDADVSSGEAVRSMIDQVRAWAGRLDLVVNNAGIAVRVPHRDLEAATDDLWQRILGVNLMGPWNVAKAAAPLLRASGGSIVNVASVAGLTVSGSSIPYAVSKAGVAHLTRLLAVALGPEVRVNAIAPGYIDTPLTHEWEDMREDVQRRAPLGRLGTVTDAAAACLSFLDNPYATGVVLPVDGGLSLA